MNKKSNLSDISKLDFEEAMDQLNEIIEGLESGDVKLSESVEKFEYGSKLAKHCKELLENAESRIKAIKIDKKGEIINQKDLSLSNESEH